jgi:iron-sulfur cluster insertion protein
MITATSAAINKIKEFAAGENITTYRLRVKVIGSGCAGFSHDIAFDESINEMDEIFKVEDIEFVVDHLSLQFLEGSEVNWFDTPMGGGFKIINPNVKSTCGCGSSVGF